MPSLDLRLFTPGADDIILCATYKLIFLRSVPFPNPLLFFVRLQSHSVSAKVYSCSLRSLLRINALSLPTKGLGFPSLTYLGSPSRGLSRLSSTMALTGESGGPDEAQTRVQQSPLASQRAKLEGNSGKNGQTAKAGGFFTLGYKEGFSQWVGIRNIQK